MRDYEVIKPFNTQNRRLKVGAVINETLNISPFTFDDQVKRGFLKPVDGESTTPVSAVLPPVGPLGGRAAAEIEPAGADDK